MQSILFLFAHQDDEVFVIPRIMTELAAGNAVHFVYLTTGLGPALELRNRESARVLASLGVPAANVHFLGSEIGVPDAQLHLHAPRTLAALNARLAGVAVDRIYTLAWEGGHHDHDLSACIAWAFAAARPQPPAVLQFNSYNGEGMPGRLFRVMHPLRSQRAALQRRRIPWAQAWRAVRAIFAYPSQRKTWAGLAPGALVSLLLLRFEGFTPLTGERLRERPHAGPLSYERWGRAPYEAVRRACDEILG